MWFFTISSYVESHHTFVTAKVVAFITFSLFTCANCMTFQNIASMKISNVFFSSSLFELISFPVYFCCCCCCCKQRSIEKIVSNIGIRLQIQNIIICCWILMYLLLLFLLLFYLPHNHFLLNIFLWI